MKVSVILASMFLILVSSNTYAAKVKCPLFSKNDVREVGSFPETPNFRWWRDNNGTEEIRLWVDNITPNRHGAEVFINMREIIFWHPATNTASVEYQREQFNPDGGNGRWAPSSEDVSINTADFAGNAAEYLACRTLIYTEICSAEADGAPYTRIPGLTNGDCPTMNSGISCEIQCP